MKLNGTEGTCPEAQRKLKQQSNDFKKMAGLNWRTVNKKKREVAALMIKWWPSTLKNFILTLNTIEMAFFCLNTNQENCGYSNEHF